MTRLALAAWCNGFTTPWVPLDCANRRGFNSEFKPSSPSPAMPRPRNVRRCIFKTNSSRVFMVLIPSDGFMHVEDGARHGSHGGELGCGQAARDGRFASATEFRG